MEEKTIDLGEFILVINKLPLETAEDCKREEVVELIQKQCNKIDGFEKELYFKNIKISNLETELTKKNNSISELENKLLILKNSKDNKFEKAYVLTDNNKLIEIEKQNEDLRKKLEAAKRIIESCNK